MSRTTRITRGPAKPAAATTLDAVHLRTLSALEGLPRKPEQLHALVALSSRTIFTGTGGLPLPPSHPSVHRPRRGA